MPSLTERRDCAPPALPEKGCSMKKRKHDTACTAAAYTFSRTRLILCAILGICILANMILIYSFSAEDKASSGNRSHGVTEAVVEVIVQEYPTMSPEKQAEIIAKYHPPVRKFAHFCEFGLLGVLTASFMNALGKGKKWLWWGIPAGFCLLYAISDEVHQIFTGRGPAVADVLIDFSGSITGIIGMNLILLWIYHAVNRREAKHICE